MSECVTQDYATTWVPDSSNERGPKMHFMNTKSDEADHITYHLSLQNLGHMKAYILSTTQWKKSKGGFQLWLRFDIVWVGDVRMDELIQGVLNVWSSDKLKYFTCSTADVNVTHSKSILCVTYVLKVVKREGVL